MRLCILGNSHIASLKLGWDDIKPAHPDLAVRFFGAPGSGLKGLKPEGNRLVPDNEKLTRILEITSEGEPVVDIADYDMFLAYGLAFEIGPVDRRVSSALIKAYCEERVTRNNGYRLLKHVQSVSDKPVYLSHMPLQADVGPVTPSPCVPYAELAEVMREQLAAHNITFIKQPPHTISSNIRTKANYTQGSTRLMVSPNMSAPRPHAEDDVKHMNGEYGAIFLDTALRLMCSTSEPTQQNAA